MEWKCVECETEIPSGVPVVALQEGLIGQQDFVPTEDRLAFCCESCLLRYLEGTVSLPRRIP